MDRPQQGHSTFSGKAEAAETEERGAEELLWEGCCFSSCIA